MVKSNRKYAPLGMPSARPFRIDGRTREVFLIDLDTLPGISRDALIRIGINNFSAWFAGETVACLTKRELKSFMRRTGLCIAERFGSTKPHAEWVRFVRESEIREILPDTPLEIPPPIEVAGYWDGADEEAFVCIIGQILGPILKRKILVSVPHAEHYHPYNPEGAFQVLIWSTPEKSTKRNVLPPPCIFDTPRDCRDEAYNPRECSGILIKDGDYAVAELFPNALYIHHDLVHGGTLSEKKIMAVLCKKVADILREPRIFDEILAKIQSRREAQQRELFCKMIEAGLSERTHRGETALEILREKVREARKKYVSLARELLHQEENLLDPKQIQEKFEQEILKIQSGQMKLVEKNSIVFGDKGSTLTVRTKPIIAYDRWTKKHHLRGRYEIKVNFEEGEIQFVNLDNSPNQDDAHLNSDGYPCLGNIQEDMTDYIAHYEVGAAITLGIAFLESPDSSDCMGACIRDYPIVPKPKELK